MSRRIPLFLVVSAALLVSGCDAGPKPVTPAGGGVRPPGGGGETPGEAGTPRAGATGAGATTTTPAPSAAAGSKRARPPLDATLPDVPPLSPDGARRTLVEAVAAAQQSPDAVRDALLAIAATSGADAVRAAAKELLATATGEESVGGYADPAGAAMALEALLRAGDASAADKGLALAQASIDDDVAGEETVHLLAALAESRRADAVRLLGEIAADPFLYASAVFALAPLRDASAGDRLAEIAADPDDDPATRAAAAATLLGARDARGEAALSKLLKEAEDEVNPFELIDGLAVRGVPETLDWIRRIADPVIAEDENCTQEILSYAAALVEVRGAGKGTPEDLAALRKLLGKDDGLCDDEVAVALWQLGDDTQSATAARVLAQYVAGASQAFDEETGVRILGALAARGGASSPDFTRAVDAAAQVPIPNDPRRPDGAHRAWRLRVAAARARLGK